MLPPPQPPPPPLPPTCACCRRCRLGAYRGLGRENAIAKFSRHVLDALPKILGGAGPGAAQQAGCAASGLLAARPLSSSSWLLPRSCRS